MRVCIVLKRKIFYSLLFLKAVCCEHCVGPCGVETWNLLFSDSVRTLQSMVKLCFLAYFVNNWQLFVAGDDRCVALRHPLLSNALSSCVDNDPTLPIGVLSIDNERLVLRHLSRMASSWHEALSDDNNDNNNDTIAPAVKLAASNSDDDDRRVAMARALRAGELTTLRHVVDLCHIHWQSLFLFDDANVRFKLHWLNK